MKLSEKHGINISIYEFVTLKSIPKNGKEKNRKEQEKKKQEKEKALHTTLQQKNKRKQH